MREQAREAVHGDSGLDSRRPRARARETVRDVIDEKKSPKLENTSDNGCSAQD